MLACVTIARITFVRGTHDLDYLTICSCSYRDSREASGIKIDSSPTFEACHPSFLSAVYSNTTLSHPQALAPSPTQQLSIPSLRQIYYKPCKTYLLEKKPRTSDAGVPMYRTALITISVHSSDLIPQCATQPIKRKGEVLSPTT